MAWELGFTSRAWKDLQALERPVQRRILSKLESVVEDPARWFRKMVDRPQYRLRIGDHRVLALLDFGARRVTVVRIGHRSGIYK